MKTVMLVSLCIVTFIAGISISIYANNGETGPNKSKIEKLGNEPIQADNPGGDDDDPLPIRGKVRETGGNNLQNVHVEIYTLDLNLIDDDYTDSQGDYQIDDIAPDTYKLYFNKSGYHELIQTIVVVGGDPYFEVGIDVLTEE